MLYNRAEHSHGFSICFIIKNPLNSPSITFNFQNKLYFQSEQQRRQHALYSRKARCNKPIWLERDKTGQNWNNAKYSQSGITVKIHTNHDGVRATAIMLRSNAASSGIATEASFTGEISSTASRVNNQELALMSLPMRWVMKATSITATEFYGSVIPSNLYVLVNEWVASSRILVFTHRFLESPRENIATH